jgi:hypothetical protein
MQTQRSAQTIASLLEGLPLFALLIATIQAFFSFKKILTLDKKIEIFIAQLADNSMIYHIFLIIYIAVFRNKLGCFFSFI